MEHASHEKIQEMSDLGIIQRLPKCIPNLIVPFQICIISKTKFVVFHATVSTEYVPIRMHIQYDFTFYRISSIIGFTSSLMLPPYTQ